MVKKKADEVEEITDGAETEISEETAVEAQAAGEEVNEATVAESTIAADETVSSEAAPAEKRRVSRQLRKLTLPTIRLRLRLLQPIQQRNRH